MNPTPFTPDQRQADLRQTVKALEQKLADLPLKHPAYQELARPELEIRLADRRERLDRYGV